MREELLLIIVVWIIDIVKIPIIDWLKKQWLNVNENKKLYSVSITEGVGLLKPTPSLVIILNDFVLWNTKRTVLRAPF